MKPAPVEGDEVTFTPTDPRYSTVTGILRDIIKNQWEEPGWHIFAPTKTDPHKVNRCWSSNGTLKHSMKAIPHHCTTAEAWNAIHSPGTPVRYTDNLNRPDVYHDTVTRSEAWMTTEPIVKINGRVGGVLLSHLQLLIE